MTTDPAHGLTVQQADALWDAVAVPGQKEPRFVEQHGRVCRAVADLLGELTAGREEVAVASAAVTTPPTGQAALRDLIAEVLATRFTADGDVSQGMRVIDPDGEGDPEPARRVRPVEAAEALAHLLPPPADHAADELASLAVNAAHALRDEKRHYKIACEENARLRAVVERVRRLHDALDAETDLTSPDDEITRGAAARKIAAALDGWTDPAELRRLAEPETQTEAHPPSHTWKVESPRRDQWASWGATYDDRDWATERYEEAVRHYPARPYRLVRATTTYTVEAEHQPDTETPDAPLVEPHPTEADLRHALAVAAKFHGQDVDQPAAHAVGQTDEEASRG